MKKTEPAHSLVFDHSNLNDVIIDIDIEEIQKRVSAYSKDPLNPSQQSVFQYTFENRVTLLWGPPGTGKTTTSAAIVMGWIENAEENGTPLNIGVGSSNWNAIDNLLKEIIILLDKREEKVGKFKSDVEVSRVRSDSGDTFSYHRINDIIVYTQESIDLKNQLADEQIISIIGSTWKQIYNLSKDSRSTRANAKSWFDLFLIDEASQLKVEHASGYFLYLKENGHLLLAGDDKQLGPIYGFQMENHNEGLFDCIYTFMKETHSIEPRPIVENYRSNKWINSWPNLRFYNQLLDSKNPERNLDINIPEKKPDNWPSSLPWNDSYLDILDSNSPVAIITYPSSTDTVSNTFEAQIISALTCLFRIALGEKVSEQEFIEKKIGIVTPHRAQRSQIQNLLLEAEIDINVGTFVDTVDRFQGQERELILSSYCVSDKDFVSTEDAFILDSRRFNVSLTRAKCKFVLLISEALIEYLPSDKIIAEDASHIQMFVEKFCDIESETTLNFIEENDTEIQKIVKIKTIEY